MQGTLYLVATPIGNLKDITLRALEVLSEVDLIACEDTRHTQKLLNHFEIRAKTISYHEHNEHQRSEELLGRLKGGTSIAVVSDAGTPAIADPGSRLAAAAAAAGVAVVPLPGPVAFVTAAAAAGLPTDSLFFGGFLPSRSGERRRRLEECSRIPATLVFYEAPHRLARSLTDCLDILGDRHACVAREITKVHEEFTRGTLSDLIARYADIPAKGEIVLLIESCSDASFDGSRGTNGEGHVTLEQRFEELQAQGDDKKTALKKAAKEFGLARSEAYRRLLTS